MLKLILAAAVLVGLSVFGMCFNIIFRKNGEFPETEVSRNKEMKKLGIRCAKEEEMKIWGRKRKEKPTCSGEEECSDCASCEFLNK